MPSRQTSVDSINTLPLVSRRVLPRESPSRTAEGGRGTGWVCVTPGCLSSMVTSSWLPAFTMVTTVIRQLPLSSPHSPVSLGPRSGHGTPSVLPAISLVVSLYYACVCMLSRFSHVQLFVTLWTVTCQVPLSTGFSRQEYWSGLPCPLPGDLPDSGI